MLVLAIIKDGISYSFESNDLIKELKQDIAEFGSQYEFYVWVREIDGVKFYVNYDFPADEIPLDYDKQVKDDEEIVVMRAGELLSKLELQNETI